MQYLPHVQLICIFLQSRPFHVIRMIITINSDYSHKSITLLAFVVESCCICCKEETDISVVHF